MYRKDFTQLSADEIDKLVDAFNALSTSGKITDFVDFHADYSKDIHRGPSFLPWHRYFLWKLEKALQGTSEGARDIRLPYWDWTRTDSRSLEDGDDGIWEPVFGGRISSDHQRSSNDTGRFGWIVNRRIDKSNPPALPHLSEDERQELLDRLRHLPALPDLDQVVAELEATDRGLGIESEVPEATSYVNFRRTIEHGSHARGHVWVGGHMTHPAVSPTDPLFYLHHCNIDRLWAIWQQNNSGLEQYSTDRVLSGSRRDRENHTLVPLDGSMPGMDGDAPSPRDYLDHKRLDYRYERDILLEIDWHDTQKKRQQPKPALLTGDPHAADLFIRDASGDDGSYPSSDTHWQSPDIWVRNRLPGKEEANSVSNHQRPIINRTNYIYVNVKNRGTETATGIKVSTYRCDPGMAMLWPENFKPVEEMGVNDLAADGSAVVGPFNWNPEHRGHECLLAVVDSPDDPSTVSMFSEDVDHGLLVRFDNNVGQRNVAPIEVAAGGSAGANMALRGGVRRSSNAFKLNTKALPKDTKVRLRVANGLVRDSKLSGFRKIDSNRQYTSLESSGGREAVIDGFVLGARESRNVNLNIDFSASAVHKRRYPVVATQIQDGEVAGRLTLELTAVLDFEDYMIGNRSSMELHRPDCPHRLKMSPRNTVPFPVIQEAIAQGYNGCYYCMRSHDTDRNRKRP